MDGLNLRSIDLNKSDLCSVLSDLECELMKHLWGTGDSTAREIYDKLGDQELAQTTVVVTLDRLHKKGLVSRTVATGKGGLHYIYSPKMSKDQFGERLSALLAEKMLTTFGPSVASYFSKDALERLKKERKKKG